MTEEILEFNAETVDEAIEKASVRLGVSPGDLSYDVLDTGSAGFMGIGARDARISVKAGEASFEEKSPPSPVEQTDPEPAADVDDHVSDAEELEIRETEQPPASPKLIEEVHAFITRVVKTMDLDARVDVYDAGDVVAVDVATEQTGLFIGQKGETIDALQHLLNVAMYRNHEFSKRLVIDSEGYRQRRVEAIQGIAHRMARRALRERRTVELPPMNPSERRIVHVYLKEDERVVTASEGAGENRRVKVTPV